MKLNTLLMFRHSYEDSSWACLTFHSEKGFKSVEEMVEAIARAFNATLKREVDEFWGPDCCVRQRRLGSKICDHCGRDTAPPKITKEMVEDQFDSLFKGTLQSYDGFWEELQAERIEWKFYGDAGMTACIDEAPSIVARTLFGGFPTDNTELIIRSHKVPITK